MKLSHNITKFYKKHHKITQNLQKQRSQHNTKFTLITHKIHLRPPQKIIVPGPVATRRFFNGFNNCHRQIFAITWFELFITSVTPFRIFQLVKTYSSHLYVTPLIS